MANKNKTEVFIGGKNYTIIGSESEEHIQKIAKYINEKMSELSSTQRNNILSQTMVSVLTAINVADDYFKLKESFEDNIKEKENELYDQVQETLAAYKDKINELLIEKENLLEEHQKQVIVFEQQQKNFLLCNDKISNLTKENEQLTETSLKLELKIAEYEDKLNNLFEEKERQLEIYKKLKEENSLYENELNMLKQKEQKNDDYMQMQQKLKSYEDEIAILQQENENLEEKNLMLKSECDIAKKELEEYIENFDK